MNAFAESTLNVAIGELEAAMLALENHANDGPPTLLGDAFRHLREVRWKLECVRRLEELPVADTERPSGPRVGR